MEASPTTSQTTATAVNAPLIVSEPVAGPSKISPTDKKQLLASLPKKKKSIRMKERKIRDNYRLRKLVTPKHAMLAINELKGVNISGFTFTQIPNPGPASFLCEATIDGVAYKGTGRSKNAAKSHVCDQALRDIMLKKMTATAKAHEENATVSPEDEVPIVTLVSYAIYRLFADWESDGFCLKCAGSKTKDPTDKCTCPVNAPHYGLQEVLAQGAAAVPKDVEIKDEDVSEDDVEEVMINTDEGQDDD